MTIGRAAWVVAIAVVAAYSAGLAFYPSAEGDIVWGALLGAATTSFALVGAFLIDRARAHRIGLLLLAAGVVLGSGVLAGSYAFASATQAGGSWPLTGLAGLLNQIAYVPPIIIVLVAVPLVFPDGRLLSGRWAAIAWLATIVTFAVVITELLRPGPVAGLPIENPLGNPQLVPVIGVVDAVTSLSSVIGFGGAWLAVALRFRRGTATERQQLKWLVAVAAIGAIAFPTAFILPLSIVSDAAFYLGFVALIGLPVAIAIAIMRYRLYEIDRLVSRTIGWAILTGAVAAVYLGAVLVLQEVLSQVTQGGALAVAASTLLAAAAFQPLRGRTQAVVDGRFNRRRYDAEREVEAFVARARDEVEIEPLVAALTTTLVRTVEPATATVWLRGPSH